MVYNIYCRLSLHNNFSSIRTGLVGYSPRILKIQEMNQAHHRSRMVLPSVHSGSNPPNNFRIRVILLLIMPHEEGNIIDTESTKCLNIIAALLPLHTIYVVTSSSNPSKLMAMSISHAPNTRCLPSRLPLINLRTSQ